MGNKFYDLEIWKIGFKLVREVYMVTQKFPKEEMYGLTSQIRRSSNSVIANIAESHGRYHYKDKIKVLYISRGEIEETQSHLRIVGALGYFEIEKLKEIDNNYEELNKKINQYIGWLSKKVKK